MAGWGVFRIATPGPPPGAQRAPTSPQGGGMEQVALPCLSFVVLLPAFAGMTKVQVAAPERMA